MAHHIVPKPTYYAVFGALLVLLLVTVAAATIDLGWANVWVALAIASSKAVLIMLFFMHVRYSERLVAIFAGASFLWLTILLGISLSDYLTRGWLNIPGK